MKCSSCKIISHTSCISLLMDKVKFTCKPTFRDVGVRQYREQTCIHHHWVHRRTQKGRCKQCSKEQPLPVHPTDIRTSISPSSAVELQHDKRSFQSKLSFSSKEIVALSCTWCKMAYHNKETCFNLQKIGEECTLGSHGDIIVPPSWIVKLPRQGSFKSSLRKSPKKKTASKKKSKEKTDKDQKTFVIKPIPSATVRPVLVFINPKSGGNQGAKLLQKFQWLLNPRQVFDLTQGGPRMGLELFRKAPNLRVLACGGDGTVGWILSVLDQINITPAPPVGVLPLGTGNDLARALGWGGGYTDEPISKILSNIAESEVVNLDRWELKVEKNPSAEPNEEGKYSLPLSVVNNYFSLGVDAHIALEFHEAREAHPERFNSRLRNKMFYGQAGGKDLLRRKWKGLAELVTLECDGKDLTSKLKEHKVHAIVFLNIPRFLHLLVHYEKRLDYVQKPEIIKGRPFNLDHIYKKKLLFHSKFVQKLEITRDHAALVRFRTRYNGFYEQASLVPPKTNYGGGTHPWNRAGGNTEPATDDGLIEVVGLTTYQLPLLQAGGHGTCITQCKSARIVTTKTIPMQVDGEACKLTPSIISLSLLNKVPMLAKCKGSKPDLPQTALEQMTVSVDKISMSDYEQHHYEKDLLKEAALNVGTLEVSPVSDLEQVRKMINNLPDASNLSADWCFVDSERFFRVDRAQEHLHFVMDIATDHLYVLDAEIGTLPQTPEDETAVCSPSGSLENAPDNFMLKGLHTQGYSLLSIDASGQTALHYGSRLGHKDIVKYLIACAPSSILNIADNDKYVVLDSLSAIYELKTLNAVLHEGFLDARVSYSHVRSTALVKIHWSIGQTALHKAAAHKRRSICCMLVAGGASLSIADHQGNTPRHLALQAEDTELAAYLHSQEHFQLVADDLETVV
uniref:Diacylglycerol kinase n=1 Tax=Timema californicum TaxID=61474 RepID=A0A7R9IYS0_TIMCA|nr:unnamed protein product [Timema californicum]